RADGRIRGSRRRGRRRARVRRRSPSPPGGATRSAWGPRSTPWARPRRRTRAMTDATQPALERLLVALLVGFLVGLDRERAEARKERALFAGVRTFPLIALAGAIPMLLPTPAGPILLVTTSVGIGVVAIVSYVRCSASGKVGATTEIAALATFL